MRREKYIGFIIVFCFILSMLTSCTIPFEKFVSPTSTTSEVEDAEIEGINIDKDIIQIKEVDNMQDNINNIFNKLGNKEFYYSSYGKNSVYLSILDDYMNKDYYNKVVDDKNNNFSKVIDDIYYNKNNEFKEANIIGAGINTKGKYFDIEVVSISDDITFKTSGLRIYVDKSSKIFDSELQSQNNVVNNTTKKLNDDSMLSEDNKTFKDTLVKFLNSMKNKKLYESVLEGDNKANLQINSLISKMKIKSKNNDCLKNLFKAGKGTYEKYTLINEYFNDADGQAKSYYTIGFANGNDIMYFKIEYSRITDEILNISQIES